MALHKVIMSQSMNSTPITEGKTAAEMLDIDELCSAVAKLLRSAHAKNIPLSDFTISPVVTNYRVRDVWLTAYLTEQEAKAYKEETK
jgi:NifU-like protein involved in Fe-S cluster formation